MRVFIDLVLHCKMDCLKILFLSHIAGHSLKVLPYAQNVCKSDQSDLRTFCAFCATGQTDIQDVSLRKASSKVKNES